MAKYVRNNNTLHIYKASHASLYRPHNTPVIVLPEADWDALVALVIDCRDKPSLTPNMDASIDAIIQRTEQSNA